MRRIWPAVTTVLVLVAEDARSQVRVAQVEEIVRIGTFDGPLAFTAVGAVIERGGYLYVAQPLESSVKRINLRTNEVKVIGRRGSGPGEFGAPRRIGHVGDTLWILDADRLSFFVTDTIHVNTIAFSLNLEDRFRALRPGVPLSGGSLLSAPATATGLITRRLVTSYPLFVTDRAGTRAREVARLPIRRMFVSVETGRAVSNHLNPFDDSPLFEPMLDGSGVVIVVRDRPSSAKGTLALLKLSPSGDTIWQRRIDYTARPIDGRALDAVTSELVEELAANPAVFGSAGRADYQRRLRAELAKERFMPPVRSAAAGSDGRIWLEASNPAGRNEWWEIDRSGYLRTVLALPKGYRIVESSHSHFWAVAEDALGVPQLAKMRIRPG